MQLQAGAAVHALRAYSARRRALRESLGFGGMTRTDPGRHAAWQLALFTSPRPHGGACIAGLTPACTSATNGIALGPDGNFWVAEEYSDYVVRMTPSGTVLGRFTVGDASDVDRRPDRRDASGCRSRREQAGLVRRRLGRDSDARRPDAGQSAAGRWRSWTAATGACTSRCPTTCSGVRRLGSRARCRQRHGPADVHRHVGRACSTSRSPTASCSRRTSTSDQVRRLTLGALTVEDAIVSAHRQPGRHRGRRRRQSLGHAEGDRHGRPLRSRPQNGGSAVTS